MEEVIFINNIKQVNIGTVEKPYYISKPTEEQIKIYTEHFKKLYNNEYYKKL